MKRIFLYGLLLYIFHHCDAQKLEIKYYPSFHLNGKCVITYNDKGTCVLQFDIIDRKDTSKVWWSETRTVSVKYLEDINRMFEIANNLSSYKSFCMDGIQIVGVFESDTLINEFVFHCLSKRERNIQYDFSKQSITTMLKVLKDRKSRRYVRVIREYL